MQKDDSEKHIGFLVLGLSLIFALINVVSWLVHKQIFLVFVFGSLALLMLGTRILISGKLPRFMQSMVKEER